LADLGIGIERRLLSERRWPLVTVLVVSQFVGEVLAKRKATADTRAPRIVYSAARFMAVLGIFSVVAVGTNECEFVCISYAFVLMT
jgi:hypothetical protein